MNQCTGNCNCCPCLLIPTSIATKNGTTTITVADSAITDLCLNEKVCINLRASIPTESQCNIIKVTDGTTSLEVYTCTDSACTDCCQYWRPCELRCRSILVLRYKADPTLFVIEKVKGRC